MDLIDKLKQLSERIAKLRDQVATEEATKNAFVLPFLQALGYDVFNPLEVTPEFTADIGTKKGEKVDYCIRCEGEPAILIECKHLGQPLDAHKSQLHRYFHVTSARFAILTNGIQYQFFTDLDKANVMDDKPFFEFTMEDLSEPKVRPLKQFQKSLFDVEAITGSASELKYTKQVKELLLSELNAPGEEFVRYIVQRVYSGRATAKVVEQFSDIVQRSTKALLSDMINQRLQSAIEQETEQPPAEPEPEPPEIETTEDELQAFRIVQAILVRRVDSSRIAHRDHKTYFSVLLDDNNRKPICRLHFNTSNRYLELFDEQKNGHKVQIESLGDIYNYSELLLGVVEAYDGMGEER